MTCKGAAAGARLGPVATRRSARIVVTPHPRSCAVVRRCPGRPAIDTTSITSRDAVATPSPAFRAR